jgi:hypothetical protein
VAYPTRIAAICLIWDPVKHKRMMTANGGPQSKEDRRQAGGGFPLSIGKAIQKTRKEHEDTLSEFESILSGIESAMKGGGLGPERMTHDDLFLEIKRALSPLDPDPTPLKDNVASVREISAREKLASIASWARPNPIDFMIPAYRTALQRSSQVFGGTVGETIAARAVPRIDHG